MTSNELRAEADRTETMARIVSYARDREWLLAKAAVLRHQAVRLEERSWPTPDDET
jgi:hypothetical protein